eukprot:270528_1
MQRKHKRYCPEVDEKKVLYYMVEQTQIFLNQPGYNSAMKWLLTIWQNIMNNPSDQQHQIVDCSREIHTKLKENKSRQFFEAILQSSGFRKSRDNQRWIFDTNLLNHLQRMYQFWSIWDLTNVSSNDTMQEFIDDGYSIEEAKLAIELSLHDPQTQMNKNIEIEQQSLDHIDEINELMSMGFTVEEARMAINFSMNDAKQTVSQEMIVPEKIQFSTELTELMQSELVDKVDSSYLFNNSNICTEKCQSNLKQCHNFIRIKKILYKYKLFTNDTKPNINDIYDGDYGNTDLLNDFNHLMHCHSLEFENTYNLLSEQIYDNNPCQLSKCLSMRRNQRDQTCDNTNVMKELYNTNDNNQVIIHQLIDRIHCFYMHSFDIGYRLNSEELFAMNHINDEKRCIDEFDQCLLNTKILKMNTILSTKHAGYGNRYRSGARYNQLTQPKNAMKEDYIKSYSFGTRFKYGYKGGEEYLDWGIWVSRKYSNFKQELIRNKICRISIQQWNNEYEKAWIHYQTDYCKQIKKHPVLDPSLYEIKLKHILALMIYCNYTELQTKLSETYYLPQQIKRHREFYYFGCYLKIAVQEFGTCVSSGLIKHFYHGISEQLLMNPFMDGHAAQILSPLSTSSSFTVATNFTNNHSGLIIEFGAGAYAQAKWAKYFSVSWLSDYGNESEYLFLQENHAGDCC